MIGPRIVAEVSCNHAGSLEKALALVDAIAATGAHALKLQTWTPGTMVLKRDYILRDGPWAGRNLYELYEQAHTPWDWMGEIMARGRDRGLEVFSSPFDKESVDFLAKLGVKRLKIASFEIVDTPLITYAARSGLPLIISTGMATEAEIDVALDAAKAGGCNVADITLLKCTSAYPADPAHANLATMAHMRARWPRIQVGLSDHTPGVGVALIAASLGASMIEKHVVLDRSEDTLDAAFSITPSELKFLCDEAPRAAQAIGEPMYGPRPSEKPQIALRRSLHFAKDLQPGHVLQPGDIVTARPADGLPPRMLGRLLGNTVVASVRRGDPVTRETVYSSGVPA